MSIGCEEPRAVPSQSPRACHVLQDGPINNGLRTVGVLEGGMGETSCLTLSGPSGITNDSPFHLPILPSYPPATPRTDLIIARYSDDVYGRTMIAAQQAFSAFVVAACP